MQYFKAILLVSILTSSGAAYALSDAYYSQGLYMDFQIAEEEQSVKQSFERIVTKLINFMSEDEDSHFSINLSYFTQSDS
ncbi:hypothetical protein EOL70_06190 [Leucothrix sargassi]|nr:hypothetical protein EOL70_06190 [Leucothrix sargassi]